MKNKLSEIFEFDFINKLTEGFPRSPDQENRTHESDAELIRQPDGSCLAITVDTLLEEYELGLIRSPYIVGWNMIAHSLSDLAAVGADVTGVLNSLILQRNADSDWNANLFKGIKDSLQAHNTFCLGGDTGFDESPAFTCVAIGRIPADRKPLSRKGAEAEDLLYITGKLGLGNQLAIARKMSEPLWASLESHYRPIARLKEVSSLRKWMKCAIDTSDSLIQALAIIAGVNDCGLIFEHREELYPSDLIAMSKQGNFPLWITTSFGLGEYEILFSVSSKNEEQFLQDAHQKKIEVFKIGKVTSNPEIKISMNKKEYVLDAPYLLNLLAKCGSIDKYFSSLLEYNQNMIKN
ncbi:MAG: thiamine-monophosphate kinase [Candidatus Riflebacteria bacterium]|nr:thiamine-monophosphate kinase [Candidatus Riflebacteria bacterium]